MSRINQIIVELNRVGVECNEQQAETLWKYMENILLWNKSVNLTAIKDEDDFIIKHFVDSLTANNLPEMKTASHIIDVGTGGGFPGIPLSILNPYKQFVLLDSLAKRLKIIDEISSSLSIMNATTVHGRSEDIGRNPMYRERFDLCVSRAVADLSVLSEYCLPFVSLGGSFVAYKGFDVEEELGRAAKSISVLGGTLNRIVDTETKQKLIIVTKTAHTPKEYPRRAGDAKRNPL